MLCGGPVSVLLLRRGFRGGRGGGFWAMAGAKGKVAFGLRHFCILSFSKKV